MGGGRRGAKAEDKEPETRQPEDPTQVSFPSSCWAGESLDRAVPGGSPPRVPSQVPPARMVRPTGAVIYGWPLPTGPGISLKGGLFTAWAWGRRGGDRSRARLGQKQGAILESLTSPGEGEGARGEGFGVDQVREETGS